MANTSFICLFGSIILITIVALASSIRIMREDRRLSVYRLGRFLGDKGPGIVLLIPFIDRGVVKEVGGMEKTSTRRLAGDIGETRTTVFTDGKVFLSGQEWDAISQSPISTGQRVRVVKIILEVEKE